MDKTDDTTKKPDAGGAVNPDDEHQDQDERQPKADQDQGKQPVPAEPSAPAVDVRTIKAELRQEFAGQLVRAEAVAAATGRFTDPEDAVRFLDLPALTKGGEVDRRAVRKAVDELLTARPYLAAAKPAPRPWGDVGGGRYDEPEPDAAPGVDRVRQAFAADN
ncbi:hypothetical protein [Streptomyces harbinensis]